MKQIWKFDFYKTPFKYSWAETFGVSIIQWIPTANGKGLKKSKLIKKFTGLTSDFDKVVSTAQAFIDKMNKGDCQCAIPRQKPFTVNVK